jgi:hypothetical protein
VTRPTARDLEVQAAELPDLSPAPTAPSGEVVAMMLRRGFAVTLGALDLPFDPGIDGRRDENLVEALGSYAFRLFLRGAIQKGTGFHPDDASRYVSGARAHELARIAVELGLLAPEPEGRYRLVKSAPSFGGMLEWYVARELHRVLGFDTAVRIQFHAQGVGGDLDVLAAAEGKLIYLELKSSPPKHLSEAEIGAFFDRLRALRPDVALFAVDTALRLSDKVLPMMVQALRRRRPSLEPVCVERELWALTPHLYAVNAKPDLIANISRAIACGLLALSPEYP